MTLQPYLQSDLIVQLHVICAVIALAIGPFALWRKRRDRLHKVLGYVWVSGMGGAALLALAIPSNVFAFWLGPIHLFSAYALWGIYVSMRAIFQRNIKLHKQVMEAMYVRGLCLAGAFNFLPGRATQEALIPNAPEIGFVIIAAVCAWAFVPLIRAGGRKAPRRDEVPQ